MALKKSTILKLKTIIDALNLGTDAAGRYIDNSISMETIREEVKKEVKEALEKQNNGK